MTTMSFDLLFVPSEGSGIPGHPIARVYVKMSTRKDYAGYGEGKEFVSNECASYWEFKGEIDRLQEELEQLKLSAQFQFDKHRFNR